MNSMKGTKLIPSAIVTAIAAILSTGCASTNTMGNRSEYLVSSTASFMAPSVTCVDNKVSGYQACYSGPSIMGQTLNAAGTVAGGYLLGQGIGKSRTEVIQSNTNGNIAGAAAISNAQSTAQSFSVVTQPGAHK